MQPDTVDAYESLIQFLYRAPIGLVQISTDGAIELLNPMSSSLLMPLAKEGGLENLFHVLATVSPQLSSMAADFAAPSGIVCESLRIDLSAAGGTDAGPLFLSISLLKLDANRLMAVLGDATFEMQREQATLTRRLNSAARTDGLTKMPNRRAVQEQVELMLARSTTSVHGDFAVLFINVDRFKQINDTMGNAAGDQVLTTLAERMQAALRPSSNRIGLVGGPSQMAARLGGDEFVVVVSGEATTTVDAMVERLLIGHERALFHRKTLLALNGGLAASGRWRFARRSGCRCSAYTAKSQSSGACPRARALRFPMCCSPIWAA